MDEWVYVCVYLCVYTYVFFLTEIVRAFTRLGIKYCHLFILSKTMYVVHAY